MVTSGLLAGFLLVESLTDERAGEKGGEGGSRVLRLLVLQIMFLPIEESLGRASIYVKFSGPRILEWVAVPTLPSALWRRNDRNCASVAEGWGR